MNETPFGRCAIAALATVLSLWLFAASASASDALPRRGALGVLVAPGGSGDGVQLAGVSPGSGADEAGLRAGDLIIAINGTPTPDMQALIAARGDVTAGDPIDALIRRDGEELDVTFTAHEPPKTRVAGSIVEYGSVRLDDGARLRTILSLPEGFDGVPPVVFFIQGIPCSSVEFAGVIPTPTKAQLDGFGEAGFATFRVEKPGVGDSEGGPCAELGFDRELAGYLAGLDALLADDRIDRDRVYLYGVSMGGIMAPLMAAEREVAGLAVWGTGITNWMEYLIDNRRNQALLFGQARAVVEAGAPTFNRFVAEMCVVGRTPAEMAELDPAFGRAMQIDPTDTGYAGRHASFHSELSRRDLFAAWADSEAPVLVMHGEYDWVAFEEESELIVEYVNTLEPGRATFRSVPKTDHGFTTHPVFQQSLTNAFQGEWDNTVGELVIEWIETL